MTYYFWTWTYDPVKRHVTVIRWVKRGTLFAAEDERYERLTWEEACQVMESDSWGLLDELRRSTQT